MDTSANDVWSTLTTLGGIYGDVQKAKFAATASAAPSGRVSSTNQNPAPGGFGPYPQAQTKVNNGASAFPSSIGDALSMGLGKSSNVTLLLLAAFLVVILAVLRR